MRLLRNSRAPPPPCTALSVKLNGARVPKSTNEYPPSANNIRWPPCTTLTTRLPLPISGSMVACVPPAVKVYEGWNNTSPSIPTTEPNMYPRRTPPPILRAKPKPSSYFVYEPNAPASNWPACWAASVAAPSTSTVTNVANRFMRAPAPALARSGQLVQLDAPVLRAPVGRGVRRDRVGRAVALGRHAPRCHAFTHQVGAHDFRARLRQPQVRRRRARSVGVTGDLDPDVRIGDERLGDDVEHGEGLGTQRRLPRLEGHAAQDHRRALGREQDDAAVGVDAGGGGRSRTLVLGIVHAVPV